MFCEMEGSHNASVVCSKESHTAALALTCPSWSLPTSLDPPPIPLLLPTVLLLFFLLELLCGAPGLWNLSHELGGLIAFSPAPASGVALTLAIA